MKCRILFVIYLLSGIFTLHFPQSQNQWENVPDAIKSRKYFKRAEWFYRQRSAPYDTISYVKLNQEFKKEKAIKSRSGNSENQWQPIGPKGIISYFPAQWGVSSGRCRALDVHPTNPDIVYIGAASGGVWKTTDGGDTWNSVSEEFSANTFGAVCVDPVHPNIIYAGTGEAISSFSPHIYYGDGLYKSTDEGTTWNKIALELGSYAHFGDIVVSPHEHNIIFMALASGNFYLGNPGNTGVWRSSDEGQTWINTLDVNQTYDIAVHPSNPNIVFATVGGSTTDSGFYISTDKGITWTKSNDGIQNPSQIARMQISVCQSNPSIIYALTYSGTTRAYKSTNGGYNWIASTLSNPLGGYHESMDWYDQGNYDLCIAVHPDDPDYVLAGNVEIHRSIDGQNFSVFRVNSEHDIWDSPMHVDYHRIVFSQSDPSIAYVVSDGGIFKTTDNGNTWNNKNNGISTIQFYNLASHPTNRDIIIGGAQDNGNFITFDRGQTNWELTTTGDGMRCFFDYSNANTVYNSLYNGTLLKSLSGGVYGTHFLISPGYESNDNSFWCAPFFMHPTDHNTIYTASKKVWRSTNGGNNWTTLSSSFANSINSMDQNQSFPEIMILCAGGNFSSNPPVIVSTDGGENWINVTENIPGTDRFISCVKTHPHFRNTLYVVRSGFGSGKVYKSTDLGTTWADISSNLPDIPHNDLFIPNRSIGKKL